MATKIRMESVQPAGAGDAAWHPDGTRVVLGGAGATLQTRRAAALGAAGRSARTGTAVVALAVHPAGTELCVAGADRTVALYDLPALDREATLWTARARVVQVAYSPTGSLVAVADAAGTVSLVAADASAVRAAPVRCRYPRSDDDEGDEEGEEGEEGDDDAPGVLGVALDPQNDFVCALYADGTFAAFRTADGTRVCVHRGLFGSNSTSEEEQEHQEHHQGRCTLAWRADGGLVAVPTGRAVTFVAPRRAGAGPWDVYANAEFGEGVRHALTCCAWCPSGRYLAVGAAADGAVLVWDVHGGTPASIAKTTVHAPPLLACAWAPAANALAVLDAGGNLGVWDDVVPRFMPSPLVSAAADSTTTTAAAATARKSTTTIVVGAKDLFAPAPKPAVQEDVEEVEEEKGSNKEAEPETEMAEMTETTETTTTTRRKKSDNEGMGVVLQGPLQPNASPAERRRRFLAFSSSASLVVGEQDGESVFVLERSGAHGVPHRQIINNNSGCTMGALCPAGFVAASATTVVFAAVAAPDGTAAQDSTQDDAEPACDWSRELPDDERVVGVAANRAGVCVATTRGFLRLFSLTGMQRAIVAAGGAHVCCVGRDTLFAEVVQDERTGAYAYQVLAVGAAGVPSACGGGALPLARGTALAWAGLSDARALCVLDTRGLLQMRVASATSPGGAALWAPVLDLGAVPHWLVDVCGAEAYLVRLRAGETCPPTAPAPLVDTLPLTPPAVEEPAAAATALVVQLMRDRLLLAQRVAAGAVAPAAVPRADAQLDVLQLQLVAALARAAPSPAREPRILALCRTLALRRSLLIAAKFVHNAGLARLAATIADMYEAGAATSGVEDEGKEEEQQTGAKRPSSAASAAEAPTQSPLARKKPRT